MWPSQYPRLGGGGGRVVLADIGSGRPADIENTEVCFFRTECCSCHKALFCIPATRSVRNFTNYEKVPDYFCGVTPNQLSYVTRREISCTFVGACSSYKCDFILFQHQIPHTKAQVLSRRVWDILTLLPTSPILLQGFQQLENSENISLQQLLDPASPQKLMYSLYIVESLSRPSASVKKNKSSVSSVS